MRLERALAPPAVFAVLVGEGESDAGTLWISEEDARL
jgi:hypothetical protein